MDSLAEIVAIGLAGWRSASLLVYEAGPWRVFQRLRSLAGVRHDEAGQPTEWPNTFPASLLSCVWCASVWTCAAMWALWQVRTEPVLVLAASAVAVGLEHWIREVGRHGERTL